MVGIHGAALNILATILVLWANAALAADPYPVKPVRVIVASGPGSGDDFARFWLRDGPCAGEWIGLDNLLA